MARQLDLIARVFPHLATFFYVSELQRALVGCRSILDVGCGASSPLRHLLGIKIGMDAYPPAVEGARKNRTHDHYLLGEASTIDRLFRAKSVDAVVALDLIEHLDEDQGMRFLESMESIARKKIVVFTPNGFLPQRGLDTDLQAHRSGWTAEMFSMAGFRIVGIGGPKRMRSEYHQMRVRPKALGGVISSLGHLAFTRNHPGSAAALLAVKELT